MKSKQALETLFDLLCEREHTNSEHNFWLKLYQSVKEDLEVLEILKKYLKVSALENWGAYYLDTKDNPIRIDIEEYAKLKEWLENETKKYRK